MVTPPNPGYNLFPLEHMSKPLIALLGYHKRLCYKERSSSTDINSCNGKVCQKESKEVLKRLDFSSNIAYCSQGHMTPTIISVKAVVEANSSSVVWKILNTGYGSWVELIFYASKDNSSLYNTLIKSSIALTSLKTISTIENPVVIEIIPLKSDSVDMVLGTLITELPICGIEVLLIERIKPHYPSCLQLKSHFSFISLEKLYLFMYQGQINNLRIDISTNTFEIAIYQIIYKQKYFKVRYSDKTKQLFQNAQYLRWYEFIQTVIAIHLVKRSSINFEMIEICSDKKVEFYKNYIPEQNSEYSLWISSAASEFDYVFFKANSFRSEETLSWIEAHQKCEAVGGFLPILRSKKEIDELTSLIREVKVLPIIEGIFIGFNSSKVRLYLAYFIQMETNAVVISTFLFYVNEVILISIYLF